MNVSLSGARLIRRSLPFLLISWLFVLGFAEAQDTPLPQAPETAEKIEQSRKAAEEAAQAFKKQPAPAAEKPAETIDPATPGAPAPAGDRSKSTKGPKAKAGNASQPNSNSKAKARSEKAPATTPGKSKSGSGKAAPAPKGPKGPQGEAAAEGKSQRKGDAPAKGSPDAKAKSATKATPASEPQKAPAAVTDAPGTDANAEGKEGSEAKEDAKTAETSEVDADVAGTEGSSDDEGPLGQFLKKIDLNSKADAIEATMTPIANQLNDVVFSGLLLKDNGIDADGNAVARQPLVKNNRDGSPEPIPLVLLWLAGSSIVLTLVFLFINIRSLPLAISTVRGKYSSPGDPGEISHFQALTSAISGTVGLGNIAGVAVGIAYGGPGVAFWMFVMGFFGMTAKFAECTLGVKYRRVGANGKVFGGAMYYLQDGLAERDMKGLGWFLATGFAICCAIAALGAGNMFQVNQSLEQLTRVTGEEASFFADGQGKMIFGIAIMLIVGAIIIFGIKAIGKITAFLVPIMCGLYVISCIVVLISNRANLGGAFQAIWDGAWNFKTIGVSGVLLALIWGIRRAAFSNEAGFGSAPIAHAAVRTRYPASEGLVALLEPFIDTVVVCSMTALVICSSMTTDPAAADPTATVPVYQLAEFNQDNSTATGIKMTSAAFETVNDNFKYLLTAAALIFAISTLLTWSYYGQQAWGALFGRNAFSVFIYKLIFLFFILVGAVISLKAVIQFSDGFLFLMAVFNLIGVWVLLPVVKRELKRYREHVKAVKAGKPSPHEQGS